jgi:RES domain-containing protein
MWRIDRAEPPVWVLVNELIEQGSEGALIPSRQRRGGVNLVLWRWSGDGAEGARVTVVDPWQDLQ